MTRTLRSLAAILTITAIVLGAPWLLLQLGQLPGFLPSWDRLAGMLLAPDSGRFLLILVWAAAWVLWAWLTTLIAVEAVALLRGVKAPVLPAASMPQGLARALVVAAAAAFIATPLHAGATQPDTLPAAPAAAPAVAPAAVAMPTQDPRPTPPPTTPAPVMESVVVEEGDTLWDLAEEHLGDPQRWPELYDANQGTPQPTGHVLQDPDQIDVGWTLTLPAQPARATTEPAPQTQAQPETPRREATTALLPADDTTPTETPPATTQSPAPTSTPSTAPSATPSATPAASPASSSPAATATPLRADASAPELSDHTVRDEAPSMYPWEVAGLLGAGTFLGVGITTLLAAARREQFRTRRPGRMIATPNPVVAPIEQTAHLATSLSGLLVARLDAVLRRLDPHTTLTAAIVARDATIVLHTPDHLPTPWIRQGEGWLLPNTLSVETVGDLVPDRPCPWPLMVTIGADTADRVVLLNLEHAGLVTVSGDAVMSADFTRYLAAELALNPWSDGVRIACAGPATQVIGMAPERLDAHLDEILTIATSNATRAADNQVPAAEGRSGQVGDETWPAAAVIAGQPSEDLEQLAAHIANHPHQTGTALLTLTPSAGDLALTPAGRIRGYGFELTAVGLTEDEAAGCADLLAVAGAGDTPPARADQLVDVTGNLLPEHRADRDNHIDTVESLLPEPDHAYVEAAAVTTDDLITVAPRVPEPVAATLQDRDPDLDAQVRAWFSPSCPYPRLSLLGPVTARCHGKPLAKQKAYYTEALAYLALHPHGVTGDQVAAALGITVERARTVISTLRLWLGTNPHTSTPHLPDAKNSPQAKARGVGLYLVEDLLVDADLFRRLRTRGISRGPGGIADLETALQLVTGRPFDQLRPAGWTWLIDGDRVDHHMICAVTDVAHILTTHHLHTGDLDAAKRAATTAIQADPDSETARLDLAGIMVQEGHSTSARQILADALGADADLDPTPRATGIFNGKDWLKTG